MDNERAIEAIKDFIVFHLGFLSGEQYEAMELAIKALEEQPQGEWTNREAVSNTTFPFWERYECNQYHKFNGYSNYCPNCGTKMKQD